jgi:hypothetical protein
MVSVGWKAVDVGVAGDADDDVQVAIVVGVDPKGGAFGRDAAQVASGGFDQQVGETGRSEGVIHGLVSGISVVHD